MGMHFFLDKQTGKETRSRTPGCRLVVGRTRLLKPLPTARPLPYPPQQRSHAPPPLPFVHASCAHSMEIIVAPVCAPARLLGLHVALPSVPHLHAAASSRCPCRTYIHMYTYMHVREHTYIHVLWHIYTCLSTTLLPSRKSLKYTAPVCISVFYCIHEHTYSRVQGSRNWQVETAVWNLAGFLHYF